jgi:phosphopantothenoylcysteine decarboxylase/phosphopantothenate--cysteine ligase
MSRDTGVDVHSDTLSGKRVLVLVTGGIAAVESVRLTRELRRHQAELTVMMSKEATKIITPLALAWASDVQVIYDGHRKWHN